MQKRTLRLNKAELWKIDGFQTKCLRSILRIPTSVSHQSYFKCNPVTEKLVQTRVHHLEIRQLALLQSNAASPDDDACRRFIVQPSTFVLERGPGASIVPIWSNLISTFDV